MAGARAQTPAAVRDGGTDHLYAANSSLWTDIKILVRTFVTCSRCAASELRGQGGAEVLTRRLRTG